MGSRDFEEKPCNCNANAKDRSGQCLYDSRCRQTTVIYKATCRVCQMFYIGCTQQQIKKRMQQNFNSAGEWVNLKKQSDSFASHFGSHFCGPNSISLNGRAKANDFRKILTMETLWKGSPISCVRGFGRLSCSLCMNERLAILNSFKHSPDKLINSCNEFYGACRHKPRFHRFFNMTPCTDERLRERVQ